MRRRLSFPGIPVFLVGMAILGGVMAGSGFGVPIPASWFGEWRLNMEKSDFRSGPPAFKRVACSIEPWEDGLTVIYDIVGARGGVTHTEWSGRFDGRDYPVQGADTALTNAYTQRDDRSYDIVTKVDGRIEATARVAVSADGQTMTTRTTIKNAQKEDVVTTTVYDRRPPTD